MFILNSLDGSSINLLIAFVAGFITFFASCLLPLVPTYLAYLSGVALAEKTTVSNRWRVVKISLLFVTGFILTFMFLGLALTQLAVRVVFVREVMEVVGGLFFMIMGLIMLGVLSSEKILRERRLEIPASFKKLRDLHALAAGVVFGFGWTPCIGPILAVILFMAARASTSLTGVLFLASYGVGLGVPFVLLALFFEQLFPLLRRSRKVAHSLQTFAGVVVILAGVLMLTGQFQRLSFVVLDFLHLQKFAQ